MPFVSFEGVDGSGKTTQVARLCAVLAERGLDVVQTKEPDGGHLGGAIRAILVDSSRATRLSPAEELLLISAARYDHVRSVIRPALIRGAWVISDRFYDSTFAFQAFETDVDADLFEVVTRAVVGDLAPDLTIVLDADDVVSRRRRAARPIAASEVDPAEALRDFARIRRGLINLVHDQPERCRLVDASRPLDAVAADVLRLVESLASRAVGVASTAHEQCGR